MARILWTLLFCGWAGCSVAQPADVSFDSSAWPNTNFSRSEVDLDEIVPGGPGKDGIPAIDDPVFLPVSDYRSSDPMEPVIGLTINGSSRAYPLKILIWHEIVNDELAGVPVTVTYCPLCNTSVVFDRRLGDRVLDFGTTGNLRHSDLIMYDRQTESWWQQYGGTAIVGELAGETLRMFPSRLESLENFRQRAPAGEVLVPTDPRSRDYGANPYVGYDRAALPFLYSGNIPEGVPPMMRVIAVGDEAFTLPLLMQTGSLVHKGFTLHWTPGQRSALDTRRIAAGRDVGNVVVTQDGVDVPHVITFAFAFFAFNPDGVLHTETGEVSRRAGSCTSAEIACRRQPACCTP